MNQTKELQAAFVQAADISNWSSPFAVTLTVKQSVRIGGRTVFIDDISASQNFSHFLNLLNAAIFKKGDLKRGARVRCIPVMETGSRLHYHACLERPPHVSATIFANLIYASWLSTRFGYWMMEVKPCNQGWIHYMAKQRTKTAFADSLDWANFYNPL